MNYFKQSALTADEIKKNEQIALQYAHWIAAKIQKDCGIRASDPRSFDLNASFPIKIKKFLIAIAAEHQMLLPHLLGETEEVFAENTQKNSFVKLLAENFEALVKNNAMDMTVDELQKRANKKISAMVAELHKQDHVEDEKLSQEALQHEEQSLAHELLNTGYIAANSPGYETDIALALKEYVGAGHVNLHVIDGVARLHDANVIALQNKIKDITQHKRDPQILMGVTHNGEGGHYVVYAMQISPASKTVALEIIDSQNDPQNKVSSRREHSNQAILANLNKAATELGYGVSHSNVRYTNEQGNDPNCPYFAVRTIIRQCHEWMPDVFDAKSELAMAAKEKDINVFKLAMIRKSVATLLPGRIKNLQDIQIDDLGVVYYDVSKKSYCQHKSIRHDIADQNDYAMQAERVIAQIISNGLNKQENLFADLAELAETSDAITKIARLKVNEQKEDSAIEKNDYVTLKDFTLFRLPELKKSISKIAEAKTEKDLQIAADEVYARFLQNQYLTDYYENPTQSACRPSKR